MRMNRREILAGLGGGLATAAMPGSSLAQGLYDGPNLIVVRFGGGVRRRETIEPVTTYAPVLANVLVRRGVLIPSMTIAQLDGVDTSHAEGTVNILTGRYRAYRAIPGPGLGGNLEPTEPTLFEYFRRAFAVPAHQSILINGEDRLQEEFLSYGVHESHGVAFRSEVLSLYRFKLWRLRNKLTDPDLSDEERVHLEAALQDLKAKDTRGSAGAQSPAIETMWRRWHAFYGDDGLKNPRGDAALTELAMWALRHLKPRLMMINYQDPDYVHWGNASHYTRAIAAIDRDLERLVAHVDADPAYRDRTVFVVVPDCGRDANPLLSVPFQHHFNTRSAHEIWALMFGPGIVRDRVLDKATDQTEIAATVAALMGFSAHRAEGRVLDEVLL